VNGVICDSNTAPLVSLLDNDAVPAAGGLPYPGCAVAVGQNGNVSNDPQYRDATHGDFHLPFGSPAVDAGDSAAAHLPTADMDGSPRIQGAAVDQGAYETPVPVPPGVVGSLSVQRTNSSATLSWTAPAAPGNGGAILAYRITMSPGGSVTMVPGTATSAKLKKLSKKATYTFTIAAETQAGWGAPTSVSG
jgi:hypothetical protein